MFQPERMTAEAILFYGLGDSKSVSWQSFYEAGRDIAAVLLKMFRPDFTLNIPASPHICLDVAAVTEALLTGCFETISAPGTPHGDLPSLVISKNFLDEAVLGVQRFKQNHNIAGELLVCPIPNSG